MQYLFISMFISSLGMILNLQGLNMDMLNLSFSFLMSDLLSLDYMLSLIGINLTVNRMILLG